MLRRSSGQGGQNAVENRTQARRTGHLKRRGD